MSSSLKAVRKRYLAIVNRIAEAKAANSNDPFLADLKILKEVTISIPSSTAADLDSKNPIAVDQTGGRYFTDAMTNGSGKIRIIWPTGRQTTLEFWIPQALVNECNRMAERTSPQERLFVQLLKRNSFIFSLLAIGFILELLGVINSGSSILGGLFLVTFFIGISTLVRVAILKRPIGWAGAFWITAILYLGFVALLTGIGMEFRASLLSGLCIVGAFQTLRFKPSVSPQ